MDAARERGNRRKPAPHQPPAGGSFSLRAKSRLRRLRSDTRLRAQPLGGSQSSAAEMPSPTNTALCRGRACPTRSLARSSRLPYSCGRGMPRPYRLYKLEKGGTHLAISTKKVHNAGQQYAAVCHLKLQLQAAQLLYPALPELRARFARCYGCVKPAAAGYKPAYSGGQSGRGLRDHPVRP